MKYKIFFFIILLFFVFFPSYSFCSTKLEGIDAFPESYQPYLRELQKKYPKSLYDRISLASHGCVVSDNVKTQSSWKKFLVSLSKFVREA